MIWIDHAGECTGRDSRADSRMDSFEWILGFEFQDCNSHSEQAISSKRRDSQKSVSALSSAQCSVVRRLMIAAAVSMTTERKSAGATYAAAKLY